MGIVVESIPPLSFTPLKHGYDLANCEKATIELPLKLRQTSMFKPQTSNFRVPISRFALVWNLLAIITSLLLSLPLSPYPPLLDKNIAFDPPVLCDKLVAGGVVDVAFQV